MGGQKKAPCGAQWRRCVQVGELRVSLEDARRRLGAQSRDLQQQWRRGVTLGDTVRLLGDINLVVDSPQRVQRLEEAKAGRVSQPPRSSLSLSEHHISTWSHAQGWCVPPFLGWRQWTALLVAAILLSTFPLRHNWRNPEPE